MSDGEVLHFEVFARKTNFPALRKALNESVKEGLDMDKTAENLVSKMSLSDVKGVSGQLSFIACLYEAYENGHEIVTDSRMFKLI